MSGLDRIRVPDDRRWLLNLMIGVLTVLALMVSASWWAGSAGRFAIALVGAALAAWLLSAFVIRQMKPRRGRKRR
ncbi:hypothetical protein OCGS_2250 [Oceaniovalibus guishaninsula JLT2003]|uniref:Uncharacterized protein n=1 Tax=Oceaniovalibus guishaninsula JLT2003 TaxID=1231392 RepID=K2H7C4_9RHOB|nr:hypothetical protein [Oceaniovalibus guishaninsula]EKE43518.1 hypothetical protein OCGS_2250 [Oceaniovalibus guishaninsula JLT2003]